MGKKMGSKLINYMLTANEKIEPGVDLVQFNQDNHDSYKVKLDNFFSRHAGWQQGFRG